MAGIGFTLKRLTAKDNLIGIVRAYTHATIASAGPWLVMVLALGGVYPPVFESYVAVSELTNFRIIVVYNFGFSLIWASPVYMVVTRYLADCIHRKDVTHTPTVLMASLGLLFVLLVPLAIFFYGFYVELSLSLRLSAIANLFLITMIWCLGIYMTALKDYKAVSRAFIIGAALAIVCAQTMHGWFGEASTLTGFNIGLTFIAFYLAGRILAEYPYRLVPRTGLKKYYRRYWELAVGGVFYNAAIWADKCVMWVFAPEAITLPSRMTYYPDYDSAMFFAYLTIVPAMAIFLFSIETNFFLRYQRFYYDIIEHKTLATIRVNHRAIIDTLVNSARNFFVVQGVITLVVILTAAQIFELFRLHYLAIGIFRLGVLGSFFHVLALFEMIILSYFDCRRTVMRIQGVFLLTTVVFTYFTVDMGFRYYGYGYFLASLVTFILASLALFDHIQKLPYHAFITNNNSLKPVFQKDGITVSVSSVRAVAEP